MGISVATLARVSGIPPAHLVEIVETQRSVTPEIALRLADHFGTSARFWLNRQAAYDRAARLGDRTASGRR
jgi:addiction module HigA family antidote